MESCSHGRSAAGGRGGNALAEAGRIPGLAGTSQVQSDWAPVARRIREEATDTWDDKVAVDRFIGKGGHFVRAAITGPGRIKVDDQEREVRCSGRSAWR